MNVWNGLKVPDLLRARMPALGGVLAIALLVALALAPARSLASPAAGVAAGETVRAVAIDVGGDRESARIVLTLSAPVEARAFLLERPDRIIIDLPRVAFNLPPADDLQAGSGLSGTPVAGYRYGLFAQDRSRIVIDLKEPALATKVISAPAAHGATLTIELRRTDRATYSRAAMQPMVEAAAALSRTEKARAAAARESAATDNAGGERDDRPLIMLDPGHGGVDPGAMRFGLQEKDVVLEFSQRFLDQIEKTGRYRVQLTRNDDSFISLAGRVRIARESGAELFISIHADSLSRNNGNVRGATVYTSSNTPTDAESAQLAAKENLADQIAGVETTEETDDVVGILADLTRRETRTLSSAFADGTIESLRKEVHLTRNPHRSAGFRVLHAPDIPSILLELGYLSSEADVALLTSEEWQGKMISALILSLDRFFARRIARQETDKG